MQRRDQGQNKMTKDDSLSSFLSSFKLLALLIIRSFIFNSPLKFLSLVITFNLSFLTTDVMFPIKRFLYSLVCFCMVVL